MTLESYVIDLIVWQTTFILKNITRKIHIFNIYIN